MALAGPNQRLAINTLPQPVRTSLRWPGRPELPQGNLAWTYMIDSPSGRFALFVGQVDEAGHAFPFEVWVNGAEQPRGLGAVAKTLSMDMRTDDRASLDLKLISPQTAVGDDAFERAMPPDGRKVRVPSLVSGFAKLSRYR